MMRRELLVSVVVWCVGVTSAAAQTSVNSTVRGRVRDVQGGLLPGVAITAGALAAPYGYSTVTDAQGRYRLVNVPPGEYTIAAELRGFAKVARTGVMVRADLNIDLDFVMQVGSIQETIVVTADTPMLDVSRSVHAVNVDGAFERRLPLTARRDYTDFLEMTPGLNSYTHPQTGVGFYQLRGSTIESHVVQIDGADMGSFRQARPDYIAVSNETVQDVQVKTAATDASAPVGAGVVINVATPSGTDTLKGAVDLVYTDKVWNASNNPSGESNSSSLAQADMALGGPILRQRSWFFMSGRDVTRQIGINRTSRQLQLARALVPGWQPFANTFRGKTVFLKNVTRMSPRHQVEGFYQYDSYPSTISTAIETGNWEVEAHGGVGLSGRLTSVWSARTVTRLGMAFNNKAINNDLSVYDGHLGRGPARPIHANVFPSSGHLQGTGAVVQLDNVETLSLNPASKLTVTGDITHYIGQRLGSHELKAGVNLQPRMIASTTIVYPNNGFALEEMTLRDPLNLAAGLIPFHRRVYDRSSTVANNLAASDDAVYVQDAWKPAAGLTVNVGIRLDWVLAHDRDPHVRTQRSLDVGPRVGVAYRLKGDGLNVLHASLSRVPELVQASSLPSARLNVRGRTDYYDNDLEGVFDTVLVTPPTTDAATNRILDPKRHQPYTKEWTVGYQHQFNRELSLGTGFVHREYRDRPALIETNGIYDNGVFRGYRNEAFNEMFLVTNDAYNWLVYDGLEFVATKQTGRLQLIGSYVRAWRHMAGWWQPNDPASFIQPSAFPNDKGLGIPRLAASNSLVGSADTFGNNGWQDHTGRFALSYAASHGLTLALNYTLQSGLYTGPLITRLPQYDPRYGPPTVRLSNGRLVSNPLATTLRFPYATRRDGQVKAPARQELDLRGARRFTFRRYSLEAGLDIFNALNGGSIELFLTGANQLYSPNYLHAQKLQSPRAAQVSLRVGF